MKCAEEYMRLYAVTDRAWVGGQTLYQQVESALKGGVTCVQLREKELDEEAFLKEAFELHDLCKKYNVPFFINDNVDIAIRCHAEGIHVGQEDMAAAQVRQRVGDEMMIGVSVHSVEEALEAVRHGADCLGVGAAFSTHTKADVDVLPEGMMKAICDAVDIPVVAIGGIHKENLLRLKGTGVNGVALVSAIFGAEDIEAECRELKALAEQLQSGSPSQSSLARCQLPQRGSQLRTEERLRKNLFPVRSARKALFKIKETFGGKYHAELHHTDGRCPQGHRHAGNGDRGQKGIPHHGGDPSAGG